MSNRQMIHGIGGQLRIDGQSAHDPHTSGLVQRFACEQGYDHLAELRL